MSLKKENKKNDKVEEPVADYKVSMSKFKGIDSENFDFDAQFQKGYTSEQFKEEMHKRIKAYPWKK